MKRLLAIAATVLCGTALADWNPGDPAKWVQLPDPTGWDVKVNSVAPPPPGAVADDFLCTQTGPITDIHIWFSMLRDSTPNPSLIDFTIWSDVPAVPGATPSMPGQLLWNSGILGASQFSIRPYGTGLQGWYDPNGQQVFPQDHNQTWQLNLVDIPNPFIQQQGTIYWLGVNVDPQWGDVGWKTSTDHWNDDAVWWNFATGGWNELRDPLNPQHTSLDMAFVLTTVPEPGQVMMMVLLVGASGGYAGFRHLRRKK